MYKIVEYFLRPQVENWIKSYIENHFTQFLSQGDFDEHIKNVILNQYLVFGDINRLKMSKTCVVNNALFNLSSGNVIIGDHVFFGHNVSIITGTHNYNKYNKERMEDFPASGNDIVVEQGAWIASNATVLGPCKIGEHSVIAAGAVVKEDVPSYHIVAGIPAKTVKTISYNR